MSKLEHYKALTKEEILYLFDYDADNGRLYYKDVPENKTGRGITANRPGSYVGQRGSKSYPCFVYKGKQFAVHRVIYFLETGEHPKIVDHIDRDIQNCKFSNLRSANHQINRLNTKVRGYKITTKNNGECSYQVRLMDGVNKVERYVGTYNNETVAKFAAWWLRELMFPGVVECPKFNEEETNAIIGIFKNYIPVRSEQSNVSISH